MALLRIWTTLAALCGGVVFGHDPSRIAPAVVAGIIGTTLLVLRRRRAATLAGLAALVFSLGALSTIARSHDGSALDGLARSASHCLVTGRVTEQAGGLGTLAAIDRADCDGRAPIARPGPVVVDGTIGDPGAVFTADGWLLSLGDDGFDLARRRSGALAELKIESLDVRGVPPGPHAIAAAVRNGLREATVGLGPRRGALLLGLTIGDTSGLDAPTIDALRRAGLSHLVAVSGSNVAIVLGAMAFVMSRFSLRARITAAVASLGLFLLIVGPDASVLRAVAMGGIVVLALACGRRAEPLHALGLALIAVVSLRPMMVYSVGLHLSAAATAGIVLWSPAIADRLAPLPPVVTLPLAATIAAQFAVAPILVGAFGQLSLAGPAANLMAIPAVAPATILGFAAGIVELVVPVAGAGLARMTSPFVGWILAVGDRLGSPSWAAVAVGPRWGWVVAAPVCAAAVRSVGRRSARR